VKQLLGKDTGPHDFQLSPADVKTLSDADLLIINGAGIEEWLGELIKKSGNKNLVVVDTSKGIKLVESPEEIEIGHDHTHALDHEHSHSHGDGANPHIWLDPVIAKKQAANIVAALQKADPANASAYADNGKAYEAKLAALDSDYRTTLAPLPNKNLVTFHDAFPYLAARYKLNYVGAISEFPEKDPSPKQLAALMDKIRSLKVGVLFAEEGYAPGLLKKIAAQTGAKVSELDTLEVGQGTPTAYLDRMGTNLDSLRKAFAKGD
jgi:ABC-type Zn uptake system ZnuABC Zn-binding protein ZnuA